MARPFNHPNAPLSEGEVLAFRPISKNVNSPPRMKPKMPKDRPQHGPIRDAVLLFCLTLTSAQWRPRRGLERHAKLVDAGAQTALANQYFVGSSEVSKDYQEAG